MSTVAPKVDATAIPAVDVFRERCEARALLVRACLYDLQDAVDGLQADAERTGLIDDIGQDAVQAMMADAFAIVRVPQFPENDDRASSAPLAQHFASGIDQEFESPHRPIEEFLPVSEDRKPINQVPEISKNDVVAPSAPLASFSASGIGQDFKSPRSDATTSTLRTAEHLIQKNDPAQLKAWLAKHTRAERLAITKHIRRKR